VREGAGVVAGAATRNQADCDILKLHVVDEEVCFDALDGCVLRAGHHVRRGVELALVLRLSNDAADAVGVANAGTTVTSSTPKPPRTAGERIVDEGDGGTKIAAYLVSNKVI